MAPHRFVGAGVAVLLASGCAASGSVYAPVLHPPSRHVDVPPGHMPPPGECRIWFPDRPPGQQPPPGKCDELKHQVPPGAVLVRG